MDRYELLDAALARGLLPDPVLRVGSRLGARARLRRETRGGVEAIEERQREILARMSSGPIAELPESANAQHYELAPEFFASFLGPRRKYSCCLWPAGCPDLASAEEEMLRLTAERAGIEDGMEVLDLGCGWGAGTLWLAERFPNLRLLAVSNSAAQRQWIETEARRLSLADRVEVRTADANEFAPDPGRRFDRVVSVEMFEHMRNWRELLRRIAGWLEPGGRLFVHVFSQRSVAYLFQGTWAAERFFTAGTMPSHELLGRFDADMAVRERWAVGGNHYARTLAAWLQRLDANRGEALAALRRTHGGEAERLLATWRLFLLSTREIWSYRGGSEWMVSHYLLEPRGGSGKNPEVRRT